MANPSGNFLQEWNGCAKRPMPMSSPPSDFRGFPKLFNSGLINYGVIGGYAVAYHGYRRYTRRQR